MKKVKKSKYELIRRSLITLLLLITFLFLLAVFTTFFAVFTTPRPLKTNYGLNFSPYYAKDDLNLNWQETYLAILNEFKPQNLRLVAYWNKIEKTPDNFDFSDLDYQINEASKRNISIILAVGRKVPRYPECFDPEWVKERSEQYAKARIFNYIEQVVERYKNNPNIVIWQVENEPFFPFGECSSFIMDKQVVEQEIAFVKSLDSTRPILVQDSGEGGLWPVTYSLGDMLGISMYRRILFDFWVFPKEIYFKYPLPSWSYRLKAFIFGIPLEKIIVTELQAEPWGARPLLQMKKAEKDLTMDEKRFSDTLDYAKNTRIANLYLWGSEWWYLEKLQGNSYYWNEAKKLFSN